MSNQRIPERKRYSLRKRLKTDCAEESISAEVSEENTRRLKELCEFITENKQNFASGIEFSDCIRLMRLETEVTEILESYLFQGMCAKNPSIHDRFLHETIKKNDRTLFMKLINHGIVKNSVCTHEIPPLFELVAEQRLRWIQSLHKAGISFENQRTKSGKPLLHFALEQQKMSKNFIRKLLFYGAELSAKDYKFRNPLQYLLSNEVSKPNKEKEKFVKLLLKFGVDVNSRSIYGGSTSLHIAVDSRNAEAVEHLLMYGANMNMKDITKFTAFQIAVRNHPNCEEGDLIDRISCSLVKQVNLLVINGKHVDEEILNHRRFIRRYKYTRIVDYAKRTQERNALSILRWSENKLAQHYRTGQLKLSKIIRNRPYKHWTQILKFRIKRARQRIILLDECEKCFITRFRRLPSVFVHQMLKFLTTTELRSLYAAFCPQSFLNKLKVEPVKFSENDDDDDENADHSAESEDDSSASEMDSSSEESDEEVSSGSDDEEPMDRLLPFMFFMHNFL